MNNYENMVDQGFLGDDPMKALGPLQHVIDHHIIPFMNDWWDPGNPVPSETDIESLRKKIAQRISESPLPEPYHRIHEFLSDLAIGIRFNRRNYVNIHPSPFIPSALASFIVSMQQPNNIVEEVSKATWKMESDSIEWLAKHLFGMSIEKDGAWGNVVSGGTIANTTAMMMARDYVYDKLSRPLPGHVEHRGVIGRQPGVVIGTAATHYSIRKSLWVLGLGNENLLTVPVAFDEASRKNNFKEDRFVKGITKPYWKDKIQNALESDKKRGESELENFYAGHHEPFSLQPLSSEIYKHVYSCFEFHVPLIGMVLTLGTTDTGTLERVDEDVIRFLKNEDIFIHGDAASGGFGLLLPEISSKVNDLTAFDSFTVDPHKMGLLHYPCGVVLFRDRGFKDQIKQKTAYLSSLAPTIEGSRAGSGSAALWLAIQTLGTEGYRFAIGRLFEFTQELSVQFKKSSYQVLHRVEMNAIAVAPKLKNGETREQINQMVIRIREKSLEKGTFMINVDRSLANVKVLNDPGRKDSTVVDIFALRIVVTNPLIRMGDASLLVSELEEILEMVRRDGEC
jgi:glutamate/tyrosine decarboxylase-like PLP-dependent enzyme